MTFAQPPHELPASSLTCLSAPRSRQSPTTRQHAAQLSSSEIFALFWPFSHASRCWQLSRKCVRLSGEPFQSGGSIRRTTKVEAGTGVPRGRLAPKNSLCATLVQPSQNGRHSRGQPYLPPMVRRTAPPRVTKSERHRCAVLQPFWLYNLD